MGVTAITLEGSKPIVAGYRSVAHLGRGPLYDVHDAWSEEREARCVVKVLRPDRRTQPDDRRRVMREGRLLLSLTHPHIVRAYETHDQPFPFIVLEAAHGATLARMIEQGPLSLGDLARVATQLCSALGYLHRQGYLHLDLQPANVAWDRGQARLDDLSAARAPGVAVPGAALSGNPSPEHARGGVLSAATDAWGLGRLLHEAATGRPPSRDDGTDDRDPLLKANGRFRPAIVWTIRRCLERAPEDRPSIADVSRAFAPFV